MEWLTLAVALVLVTILIAGAAVLAIAAYVAQTLVQPRRDWQPEGWQPLALPLESVRFPNSVDLQLSGWLASPQPGWPVIIICHGFGTNRREVQDFVPGLSAEGYGALLFDFQGHGESDGRYTTIGRREVDDLLSAVRFLQQRFGDDIPLTALGVSMGAAVAIMAAAQCPAIKAVVADSAFATLERAVRRSFRLFTRLPPQVFARPTIWWAERFTGARVAAVRPIDVVAAISPRPLLLIQTTEDVIVDPEDVNLLYAAAGEPKGLWRVDGGGHVQTRSLHPQEYAQRIRQCLAQGHPKQSPVAGS